MVNQILRNSTAAKMADQLLGPFGGLIANPHFQTAGGPNS